MKNLKLLAIVAAISLISGAIGFAIGAKSVGRGAARMVGRVYLLNDLSDLQLVVNQLDNGDPIKKKAQLDEKLDLLLTTIGAHFKNQPKDCNDAYRSTFSRASIYIKSRNPAPALTDTQKMALSSCQQ